MYKLISFSMLVASIFSGCSSVQSDKVSPTVVQTVVIQAEQKTERRSSCGDYFPTWHGVYYTNNCNCCNSY